MAEYKVTAILSDRGLLENVEDSMMPTGYASKVENWVPDPSGSLRPRLAWSKGSTSGAPSTRKGKGIGHLARPLRPTVVQRVTGTAQTSSSPNNVVLTFPVASTTGNTLIIKVAAAEEDGNTNITTPTNFTSAVSSGTSPIVAIYYRLNAPSTTSVTVSQTGTGGQEKGIIASMEEVTGITTSSALDKTASASGTTNPQLSGTTATTTVDIEFYTAIMAHTPASASSYSGQTNSFVEDYDLSQSIPGMNDLFAAGYSKVGESLEAVSFEATMAVAATYRSAIATFKASSAVLASSVAGSYLVAHDNTTSYDIYKIDRSALANGTYSSIDTVTVTDTGNPVAFTSGLGNAFYTNPLFSTVRRWDGLATSASAVTGSPPGRCIAFHKDRLWVGGTNVSPSKLHFSDVGDYTTWGTNSNLFVNRDDGEAIEDIVPFQNVLIVGKQTGLWALVGNDSSTFTLNRLPVGGVAPGRTLMPTPYGVICAGRHHVWLITPDFDVKLISKPISESYGLTGDYITSSFINDTVYINDAASGKTWVLDLSTGVWWVETMDSEKPAVIFNHDEKQLMAPSSATVGSLLQYRLIPGSMREKDYDTLSETFSYETGELWPVGSGTKFVPRHLYLRIRQRAGNATMTPMEITPIYNGVEQPVVLIKPRDAGALTWREKIDVGFARGINWAKFNFQHQVPSGETVMFDIEEIYFGYDVLEKH